MKLIFLKRCRLQIRWKVTYLKSVWVKGMIEKNAKVATEEFYRVWAEEGQKELKKRDNFSSRTHSYAKLPIVGDIEPVVQQKIFDEEESTSSVEKKGLLFIPQFGLDIHPSTFTIILFGLLVLFSGIYFGLRIKAVNNNIATWEEQHYEIEDRLIFLQSFISQIASNNTDPWGSSREHDKELNWKLTEWQDEIQHLQTSLSSTLDKVGKILESSSSKKLGHSEQSFLLQSLSSADTKIIELTNDNSSSYWMYIFLFTIIIGSIGGGFFYMTQA